MSGSQSNASILVVDDESSVADAYALRLGRQYDGVETAYGGREALRFLEEEPADVVLLDRRMPELSGDEVLEEIRERGYDCQVIMVTAVDADFDIIEMPFDDYLQKPIEKEDLFAAVEQQLHAGEYDETLTEYFEIRSKIAVLEAEKPSAQLEDNKKYRRLTAKAEDLEAKLDDALSEFDDIADAFASIGRS